jgi:dTDP-glucose 4,6-dehydratase
MILVTGGAGFIGSNFVLDWVRNSTEAILNVDKLSYAGNLENLKSIVGCESHFFVKGDIENNKQMDDLFGRYKPRAIVNFAAESHVDRSILEPDAFIKTNVMGTFCLLKTALKHWRTWSDTDQDQFRFLHVSTDEVYGSLGPNDPAFTESNKYEPNSPYSASKAASDHLVKAYYHTYGLPVLVTNCSNNFGPFHFPEKLIPLVINNAISGKKLPIYGDGQQVRDWLFVSDHCEAIKCVLQNGRSGEVYNIGGNSERTNIEVVKAICGILDELHPRADGNSYSKQIVHVADRPGHDRRYAVNSTKIRQELGWSPKESFESGILRTVQWFLSNQSWVEDVTSGAYRGWVATQYGEQG